MTEITEGIESISAAMVSQAPYIVSTPRVVRLLQQRFPDGQYASHALIPLGAVYFFETKEQQEDAIASCDEVAARGIGRQLSEANQEFPD